MRNIPICYIFSNVNEFLWKMIMDPRSCKRNAFFHTLRERVSVLGVFLVRIFPHSDWIRRNTEYLPVFSTNATQYGPKKTPNTDTFHAVTQVKVLLFHNLLLLRYSCIVSSVWDSLSKLLVVGSIFKNMNQSLWMNIILFNWGKRRDFSKKDANNENNK